MLIDWTAIRLLYVNELRSALRERAVVVNAVLIPLLMYPLIMWAGFSAFLYIAARTDSLESRVEVAGLPAEHRALAGRIGEDDSVVLVERDLRTPEPQVDLTSEILQRIRSEELDAALVFGPGAGGAAGHLAVTLLSDTSQDRSRTAHGRLERTISEYRSDWLERLAKDHGLSSAAWQVIDVRGDNLASGRQMGQFLLGLLIPLFFIIMIAGGCLYPAIDSTAGERERNTWETTCTLATGRLSVVTAKYLYVITMGAVAGVLNVGAMVVSFRSLLTPFLARIGNGGAAGST